MRQPKFLEGIFFTHAVSCGYAAANLTASCSGIKEFLPMGIGKKLWRGYGCVSHLLDKLQPLALLGVRIWAAAIFFKSGLVKVQDMENTMLLFEYEYQVPYLPVEFAAYAATFNELVMPLLLVLGFFTRAAAIPLLVMTAVIQFTYQEHLQHFYWALMLGMLMVFGPGKISMDHLLNKKTATSCCS
jgi:putative oxidoreductase